MATTNITFRMDENLKKVAETIFDEMGMNMTTALTIFTKAVVKQRKIPFEITAEAGKFAGYSAEAVTDIFRAAVECDVRDMQAKGIPAVRYDAVRQAAYLEYTGEVREYVDK